MTMTRFIAAGLLTLVASGAFAQDPELLIYDYAGYEDPAYHPKYAEKNGVEPTFTFFGDEEEALQKVLSGFKVDVAHICAGSVNKWKASDIIMPWDISKVTMFKDIDRNLTGENIGETTGDVYFIPTDFGSTAISYNKEKVPDADVASLQVFKDPKYAGRMSIPDNVDDAYALAYLATGVTNWQNATPEQFKAASDWLREVHKNLLNYWVDPGQVAQDLQSGQVLIAWTWNETLPTMAEQGFPIGFQREAKEGSSIWMCGLVHLKDHPGSDQKAYDYVDAFLDPSSTEALIDAGYGQANGTAMAALGAEKLDSVGLGKISAPILAQLPMSNEQRQMQSDEFEKIKAGF